MLTVNVDGSRAFILLLNSEEKVPIRIDYFLFPSRFDVSFGLVKFELANQDVDESSLS